MVDEHLARHLILEKRRSAHERRVGAKVRGTLRCRNRRPGRFAACADDERPILRHDAAGDLDDASGFLFLDLRRFAVRAEHHEPGERRRHPAFDVAGERLLVQYVVAREWSGDGGEHAGESLHGVNCTGVLLTSLNRGPPASAFEETSRLSGISTLASRRRPKITAYR